MTAGTVGGAGRLASRFRGLGRAGRVRCIGLLACCRVRSREPELNPETARWPRRRGRCPRTGPEPAAHGLLIHRRHRHLLPEPPTHCQVAIGTGARVTSPEQEEGRHHEHRPPGTESHDGSPGPAPKRRRRGRVVLTAAAATVVTAGAFLGVAGIADAATPAAAAAGGSGCDDGAWQVADASVQGAPAGFGTGDTGRTYLWHDTSGWHVRTTDVTSGPHHYSGTIAASPGAMFSQVAKVELDPGDQLYVDDHNTLHYAFTTHEGSTGSTSRSPPAPPIAPTRASPSPCRATDSATTRSGWTWDRAAPTPPVTPSPRDAPPDRPRRPTARRRPRRDCDVRRSIRCRAWLAAVVSVGCSSPVAAPLPRHPHRGACPRRPPLRAAGALVDQPGCGGRRAQLPGVSAIGHRSRRARHTDVIDIQAERGPRGFRVPAVFLMILEHRLGRIVLCVHPCLWPC